MAVSPNTDNYTLGKGVVYFNEEVNNVYQGERDLGNAPEFTFNVAIEKLEHYSSRGGLRAKDKEIISEITPGVAFTLDEINKQNLALLTLADINEVVQTAGYVSAEVVASANLGMRAQLDNREIGTIFLATGAFTGGPFTIGETITGGTSAATGILVQATDSTGIWVAVTSGTFDEATELLTGGTSSATATSSAVGVWTPGVLLVQDDADTVTYVAGTDYEVSTALQDDHIGRIKFLDGGTLTEGEEVHVTYGYAAVTYNEIRAFTKTSIEGFLRFVSDNPAGNQQELEIWRVSLTPSGDTAMIGEDWSTLGFTGEILKDETGHPNSPYFNIVMS